MISVMAKISVPNSTKINLDGTTNFYKNNISSDISACIGKKYESQNPFILGLSDLSLGAELVDTTIPYFIGGDICDDSEQFFSPYVMNISSDQEFDSLTFVFDTYNNRHPNTIRIDSQDFIVSSSIVSFSFESSTSHIVSISNWNTPDSPLIIQGILSGIETVISPSQILNLGFSNADRGDTSKPSWGIYSNSGTLSFIDNANIVNTLKMSQYFYKSKLQIFLKNAKAEKLIGTFSLTNGDINEESKTAEISFADDLEKLQDIKVNEKKLIDYDNTVGMTLEDIRVYVSENLVDRLGIGDITMGFADDETRIRWAKIWIKYPMVETSSYWGFLTKCCELSGCYVSCDEIGRALIKYGGGT